MNPSLPEGWTQSVRNSGLVEWVCPHGVGHPAPNAYQEYRQDYGGHGCDGCCRVFHDKSYGVWREAPDLILMKMPGVQEFGISNEAAESFYTDFHKVVTSR